jgi:hypothetical protein
MLITQHVSKDLVPLHRQIHMITTMIITPAIIMAAAQPTSILATAIILGDGIITGVGTGAGASTTIHGPTTPSIITHSTGTIGIIHTMDGTVTATITILIITITIIIMTMATTVEDIRTTTTD